MESIHVGIVRTVGRGADAGECARDGAPDLINDTSHLLLGVRQVDSRKLLGHFADTGVGRNGFQRGSGALRPGRAGDSESAALSATTSGNETRHGTL